MRSAPRMLPDSPATWIQAESGVRVSNNMSSTTEAESHAEAAKFRKAEAAIFDAIPVEIGNAGERIAVGPECSGEPDAWPERIEQLHYRDMAGVRIAAVGEQALAMFGGEEGRGPVLAPARVPARHRAGGVFVLATEQ